MDSKLHTLHGQMQPRLPSSYINLGFFPQQVKMVISYKAFPGNLIETKVVEELFARFERFLNKAGFRAANGQIIDGGIVNVPCNASAAGGMSSSKPVQKRQAGARRKDDRRMSMPAGAGRTSRSADTPVFAAEWGIFSASRTGVPAA